MSTSSSSKELYIFVAHTNLYSGNFERELTAYCTGQVGECEVGDEHADMFREEVEDDELIEKFAELIQRVADEDNGCERPTEIWPTPARYNDGYGNHYDRVDDSPQHPAYESVAMFFSERPTQQMIDLMKQRCYAFAEEGLHYSGFGDREELKITGFQLLHRKTEVVTNEVQEELEV